MDEATRVRYGRGRSTDQALSKTHGDWYEYLLAAAALRVHKQTESRWLAVQLPNKTGYAAENLYQPKFSALITDLKKKVVDAANVILESSNPDFVILHPNDPSNEIPDLPDNVNKQTLEMFRHLYQSFDASLDFGDIAGYLGTKFTLRPDRRLQLAHEGSLVKALYVHIQTRLWWLNPPGIRYYAATSKATDADQRGLRTVATHSIITVNSQPQRAVDRLWVIRSMKDAEEMFAEIYKLSDMQPDERDKVLRHGPAIIDDGPVDLPPEELE